MATALTIELGPIPYTFFTVIEVYTDPEKRWGSKHWARVQCVCGAESAYPINRLKSITPPRCCTACHRKKVLKNTGWYTTRAQRDAADKNWKGVK